MNVPKVAVKQSSWGGAAAALACLAVLLAAACSRRPGGTEKLRVGMLPKLVGIPYFNACREGAEEAARALGVELVYDGPDRADSNRQIEIASAWVARDFDAVAVAPNNPEAIAPVLRRALRRGVRVVTWDTDSVAEARELFLNQVSYEAMARVLVDLVVAEIGPGGRVALISGTETAANQNTWMGLMREYARRTYPELEFVEPVEYPGEDEVRAYQSAAGLLRRPDRPGAIVGMTTVSAPAAAKAVADAGLGGKVTVTGITLPSAMKHYVERGVVKKFVLWNPFDLGYLTVHAAKALAAGEIGEGRLQAGRLGERPVRDREVILGEPLVFDRENIGRYPF